MKNKDFLSQIEIKNFRAHESTGPLNFGALNIFVGSNNSGKSSILYCIEAFLRSASSNDIGPLSIDRVQHFSSFDAAVRKAWSKSKKRAQKIELNFQIDGLNSNDLMSWHYEIIESKFGGGTSVSIVRMNHNANWLEVNYSVKKISWSVDGKKNEFNFTGDDSREIVFHRLAPFFIGENINKHRKIISEFSGMSWRAHKNLEIIDPHRPAPRSIYVLDDPNLQPADKEMVSYLMRQWTSRDEFANNFRNRLSSGLNTLGLAKSFKPQIASSKKSGSSLVEIIVAPNKQRQTVTIADAGFGLSQALPLLVQDARLENGYLIAYQPELHLHPYAQSKMADIFAASVKRGNQLFIETHSVDLVLGIQRAVAHGLLSGDDVSIFFVENDSGSAVVKSVPLDSLGGPKNPFPSGFLDVGFQTAREISIARINAMKNDKS